MSKILGKENADKTGSPMDWFNKNADKLPARYQNQWVLISGKGVEFHSEDLDKVIDACKNRPECTQEKWISHRVPSYWMTF